MHTSIHKNFITIRASHPRVAATHPRVAAKEYAAPSSKEKVMGPDEVLVLLTGSAIK